MLTDKNYLKEIDDKNIGQFRNIDYEEPFPDNLECTCLACGITTTPSNSSSYEGHNLICNQCITRLTEYKHMALNQGMFIIKFIHNTANIWDILPLDCFEHM